MNLPADIARLKLSLARTQLQSFLWHNYRVILDGDKELHLCGLVRDILELEEENRARIQEGPVDLNIPPTQAMNPSSESEKKLRTRMLLITALKWIRRMEERESELPKSFFEGNHPMPLRKALEKHLEETADDR